MVFHKNMDGLNGVRRPKTHRGRRHLEEREPKVQENTKKCLFIRGGHCSITVSQAMKELAMLKKPFAIPYQKKNMIRPFEDHTSLEFFSQRADASLFVFGSHSKKRPNNLVFGRMFNHQLLDMIELGISRFQSMATLEGEKIAWGIKPCLAFSGELFDIDPTFIRLKNLLIDLWSGPLVDSVNLQGLEHLVQFTTIDQKQVAMRSYRIKMKKSNTTIPRVELEAMGPNIDFELRRSHLASEDLFKEATRKPKKPKLKPKKNVSFDGLGTKLGRVHVGKQDMSQLKSKRTKALRTRPTSKDSTSSDNRNKSAVDIDH